MKKILLVLVFGIFINVIKAAPTVYAIRIVFKNKLYSQPLADSLNFFTLASLHRRHAQGVVFNELDRPVSGFYIDSAMHVAQAFRLHNVSRWFNQIVVLSNVDNIIGISGLPFVESVKLVGKYNNGWGFAPTTSPNTKYETISTILTSDKKKRGSYYGDAYSQIHATRTDFLHNLGFKGEGMNVAVLDMGFSNAKKLKAFDSILFTNRYIDQWNFVRDTSNVDTFSFGLNIHGTDALSCMGAELPNFYVGSAPKSNYAMYITEDYSFESPIEEDNWVSAAERADSLGVQLINTSLGYYEFDADFASSNYTYANDFNGHKTLIARGNNMAVAKGIFCVTSIGNAGYSTWRYMFTPADADSVYSVGIVDSFLVFHPSSSRGPNAAGQIKPDGVDVGVNVLLIDNPGGGIKSTGGSSFSGPLLAGGIVCLMQALPKVNIYQLRRLIHQCSSTFTTPNDSMGYGIPNFEMAYNTELLINSNQFVLGNNHSIHIYPNPTSTILNISLNNNQAVDQVEVLNTFGKIISVAKNINAISTNLLTTGTYFLRIFDGKNVYVKSFLKQ
jgi:serine protease AprX